MVKSFCKWEIVNYRGFYQKVYSLVQAFISPEQIILSTLVTPEKIILTQNFSEILWSVWCRCPFEAIKCPLYFQIFWNLSIMNSICGQDICDYYNELQRDVTCGYLRSKDVSHSQLRVVRIHLHSVKIHTTHKDKNRETWEVLIQ